MKYCNKCNIDVAGQLTYCPLCQNELIAKSSPEPDEELFPDTYELYTSHHMLLKVLGFIFIVASSISVLINYLVPSHVWWSVIVVISTACIWLSLATAISKHRNILKYMLYQSIILCLFLLFLDVFTGFTGWSMTFAIPMIFTAAMLIMYMLSKILHLQPGDYVIYLLLDALFGIICFVSICIGRIGTHIPSLICIMISLISVLALIIFEGRTIFAELNRRLHL